MKITLKDGSVKEYGESKSIYDIAFDISEGLARAACCAKVDGKVQDLRTVLDRDCELQICTANDEEGLATIRHTASHVLAEAVKNLFPRIRILAGCGAFFCVKKPGVLKKSVFYGLFISPIF